MKSNKDKGTAAFLALFLGGLGIHRFYVGRKKSAWAMLLCGITVILMPITAFIALFDFFGILSGTFKDSTGATL